MWLSLVEHLVWDQGVASSNLVTSIFYWKILSTFSKLKPLWIGLETCFFHVFSYAFSSCVIFRKRYIFSRTCIILSRNLLRNHHVYFHITNIIFSTKKAYYATLLKSITAISCIWRRHKNRISYLSSFPNNLFMR